MSLRRAAAVVLGAMVVDEQITFSVVAGMAIVLISVALVRRRIPTPDAHTVT